MMKFMKGIMIGTIVSAGAIWMYGEVSNRDKKKMMFKRNGYVGLKKIKFWQYFIIARI